MAGDYDPNALKPGTKIAGYEILRVIGAGGFGITYEAESPITGKHVAIKEFFPRGIASRESSTKIAFASRDIDIVQWALKRFESSTTDQCKLKHPNIVEVIHYLKENDTGYMIMEFVEGKTLEQWLRLRKKPPTLEELRPLMLPVLDALIYLHKQKLIHRDIAPDNIMIRPDGRPLIIDFGAIKVIEQQTQIRSTTNRSFTVSKQFYSPPEQVHENSDKLDVRADVYATGATLYRALAGRPPSAAEERTQQIAFGNGDPFQPLGKLAPQLPAEIAAAIDRSLAFHAKDRIGSIAELRDAIGWSEAKIGSSVKTPTATAAATTPARTFSAKADYAPVEAPDRPQQNPMRWIGPAVGVATVVAAVILVVGLNPLNLFGARGPSLIVQQPPPVLTREPQKVEPPVAPAAPKQQTAKREEPVAAPAPAQQPQPAVKPEPKPDPLLDARRDFELAQRVDTIGAYDQFLLRHPEGFYAALAHAQRQRLLAAEAVELTKKLNVELRRVGCSVASGDAEWSQASRNALQAFNQHAATRFDINTPSAAAFDAVRARADRVCPLVCGAGQRAQGDTCVAVQPPVQRQAPATRQQQQQPQVQQQQKGKFSCRWGDATKGELPHRQVCGFF